MSKKKGWKKTGKSRRRTRTRTFSISAKGSSDLSPEAEIAAVYDYIRKYPGKMKGQILKRSGSMGMTRVRLHQRWDTIRDYLRDVGDNHMNRRNPDGEPWIFGVGVKKMKYYATDPDLDFVPAEPITKDIDYTAERIPRSLARVAEEGLVPVIDEPVKKKLVDASFGPVWTVDNDPPKPTPPRYIRAEPEIEEPKDADYVTIRYRGSVIRIPAGSDITLD